MAAARRTPGPPWRALVRPIAPGGPWRDRAFARARRGPPSWASMPSRPLPPHWNPMTRTYTNRQLNRSLIAIRMVANCQMTNLTAKVLVKFSVKNTITNSFSPPQTLRFTDIKNPCLKNEEFPKISVPNRFSDDGQFCFTDTKYENVLFF